MKAALYHRYGPPEVLEVAEVPEPVIKDRQLLVKVRAAAVNPVDWKLRSGKPRIPFLRMPRITGLDIAGEIVEIGRSVERFKTGESVYAMLSAFAAGGCAAYAAVPQRNASRKPGNLTMEEAAAVPLAALTALRGLRDQGRIKHGDRVLINGASGGVGSFAVQIARVYGAEVTAVTSGRNLDFVKELGADYVVDYTLEDFTKGSSRYDLIFDVVSNRSFRECQAVLSPKGVYLSTLPQFSTILQIVIGSILGGKRASFANVRASGKALDQITEWIEAGKLRPHIDRVMPLSKIAEAHTYSETGRVRGKIVIEVQ